MWFELLITAISSGSLFSAATWFVSKKKRNNDFLSDLQNSIDILTKNYTETLNKLVDVQRQNVELINGQSSMNSEIEKLKRENCKLLERLNITLKELSLVKEQNATLLSGQLEMQKQIESLKKENSTLLEKINGLIKTTKNEN